MKDALAIRRGICFTAALLCCSGVSAAAEKDAERSAAQLVTPAAERAIELGLKWLSRQQRDDGGFGAGPYRGNVAVSALAGMAMMSGGNTPGRGPYGGQLGRCLDYLLGSTQPSGFIAGPDASRGPMYGHGFATMFLADCYGMSPRPELRDKLTKAVRIIVNCQNKDGGWRYQPVRADADISVTVCQIMALRAARNAGLFVPNETIDRSVDYVKRSQNADGGFMYMIQGGESAFPRSAAAVAALYSAGIYKGPEITKGLDYLMQFLPSEGATPPRELLLLRPILRRPGHVAGRRPALEPLVSGRPRRADRPPAYRRILDHLRGQRKRMRHGDGVHRARNAEQLFADFSAMNHLQLAILLLTCLLLAPAVGAEAPLAVPAAGEPFHAELTGIAADGQITFSIGPKPLAMPAADLVCWGRCPEQGRGGALVFDDGTLLMAEIIAADKEKLIVNSDVLGTLKLPLEAFSGIVFQLPSQPADRDKLVDRLARAAGDSDRLLLHNGDELAGLLTGIVDDAARLRTDVGPVEIKIDRAAALVFNPALKHKTPKSRQLRAWAGLSDGSRLLATRLLMDRQSLRITAFGQTFSASPSALVFLQPLGGRAVYLSDLKPAEYRQTPYLDLLWPYRTDRNVTGGMLRCGGRLYLKGLGVHSAARLVYAISPLPLGEGPGVRAGSALPHAGEGQGVRARRFEAELGVDDSTGGRGSVQFRVLVDGREKFASPIVRGGDAPVPVSVDITDAEKLELVVDYADRADVLDHADWLNARMTK